jgi:hypothetical protein
MKTQTDRKIADELQRTFDAQKQAQVKRQELERETAIANLQAEVVRSEQMVRITEKQALAVAEKAKGDAAAARLHALAEADALRARSEAEAASTRVRGDAEAQSTRAVGAARAEAYEKGRSAMGGEAFAALQLASVLAEHGVKLVPDISVGNEGQAGLATALLGRMLAPVKVRDGSSSKERP